jgi:hypothetical protein
MNWSTQSWIVSVYLGVLPSEFRETRLVTNGLTESILTLDEEPSLFRQAQDRHRDARFQEP